MSEQDPMPLDDRSRAAGERGFLWGTATAGHQIDGDSRHSDWWAFEQRKGRHRSGLACDFARRFPDDLQIAKALGTNAFRFSLEWARVEPSPGKIDESALRLYHRLVDACLENGLEPVVTLVHFTLPAWARRPGWRGWRSRRVVKAFERHVRRIAEELGDRVSIFVTVNEPAVFAAAAYLGGLFPPGRILRPDLARQCEHGLFSAHTAAYRVLHDVIPRRFPGRAPLVGLAKHVVDWTPGRHDPFGVVHDRCNAFNWRFLDAAVRGAWSPRPRRRPAERHLDFVGLNYYTSCRASLREMARLTGLSGRMRGPERSDMGWPVVPEGLTRLLLEAHRRYQLPILITENGIADGDDTRRASFIREHIRAVERAHASGANVFGYLHWSLLDNFEWHEGYWPRFGLVEVDYGTQRRTIRPSANAYRDMIRARSAML